MNEKIYTEPSVADTQPAFSGRLCWGAIFAGVFVTLVTGLILSLLGVAIGAGSIEPLRQQQPLKGLGVGGGIWLLITGLISSFFGAWVAGRASEGQRKADGSLKGDGYLHGLVTWGVATICMGLLVSTALGTLLGGAASLLGKTVSATAQVASTTPNQGSQPGVNWENVKQEAMAKSPQASALSPTGRTPGQQPAGSESLPAQVQQNPQLLTVLTKMFSDGGAAAAPAEREQAINILVAQGNVSRQEAGKMVDGWDQKYQEDKAQAEQKAREAGDVAARGVSRAALASCILLILWGIAAVFGGRAGELSGGRFIGTRRVTVP